MMSNKVAFVIVGWNNKDLLKDCFGSILAQTYQDQVIYYVDNDSKDDSVEFVAKNYPDANIIQPGTNTGFAKGNNIGIAQALQNEEVDFIALLNSDAQLHPEWVRSIVNFAQTKPKGALFQGTTLDYYDTSIVDSTHIFISRNGQGTQGSWRNFKQTEFGPKKVFGVNAAACMISRSFIEAQPFATVFDETFFMYLEDVDLCTRATIMGWDNYLVPGAVAYHMGSVSSGKNPGFSLYMTFRNNSGVLFKNFPLRLILRMLPKLIRGDIDTLIELGRQHKKGARSKVIKGRLVGLLRLPLFVMKRRTMQRNNQIDTDYLWVLMDRGY